MDENAVVTNESVENAVAHIRAADDGKQSSSPLHMIRQKEVELSGKLLSVRKEAEDIVAKARHDAAEIVRAAQEEGEAQARERESEMLAEGEREAALVRETAEAEIAELRTRIDKTKSEAVRFVMEGVTSV